jgi:hypothetical protein
VVVPQLVQQGQVYVSHYWHGVTPLPSA